MVARVAAEPTGTPAVRVPEFGCFWGVGANLPSVGA